MRLVSQSKLTDESSVTTRKADRSLRRYCGARFASGFANQLHHLPGHDRHDPFSLTCAEFSLAGSPRSLSFNASRSRLGPRNELDERQNKAG